MIRIHLLAFCLLATMLHAQTVNYAKAPNSYIYDLNLAYQQKYGGLEIPVKKAYEVWANYQYLKTNGLPTPIPAGIQSASIYWEDTPGLIDDATILPAANPSDSTIKVKINKGKGKGNAVVAFKVDGIIFWSWHIWVTDNPENGVNYSIGTETNVDGVVVPIEYMDRNLGATSNDFLGNEWQKTGGLLYEWGRKDPFPPLVHKDAHFYSISGEVGTLKHPQVDPANTIPVQIRPFNEIEKNIQYSVANPLTFIVNTEATGNWFSNSRYRIPGASPAYFTWDLWSDNAKGGNSNGNSSNTALKNESRSYELKSELDPCPNGWRIPSYYGRETQNNNLAFFGKRDWNNDDSVVEKRQLFPASDNVNLSGVKVYPGIGMDFTNAAGGSRNIGKIPTSGAYVYYPNVNAPNAPIGVIFQDNFASTSLWSSTFGYDGARAFSMVSDPLRTSTTVGLHAIYNNQTQPTKTGNSVRCMKDPNILKIGNFSTPYFVSDEEDFRLGLDDPNSYLVLENREFEIPVAKAFSVYNQLLSNHKMLSADNLKVKVLWTTNASLIEEVKMNDHPKDGKFSKISIKIQAEQFGNAVISIHQADVESPALWSWHIWVPQNDPTQNEITYTTENKIPVSFHFVNPTASKVPVLKTTFMDRNLGAESAVLDSGYANGLYYQWGRKDPIPSFAQPHYEQIYLGIRTEIIWNPGTTFKESVPDYATMDLKDYQFNYTDAYANYGSTQTQSYKKIQENILYSVKNPMRFMYQPGTGQLYNGGNHYSNDLTKVRDWVSDERNEADNRWGHADKKSPFDPCPEGWRVPDVSFTHLYTGSKGTSPWYNGFVNDAYGKPGVIQDQWYNITSYYSGSVEGTNGWKFDSPTYSLGSFPRDGIMGELGGNRKDFVRSGVWTASLADLNTGFALALQFEGNRMQTGTGVYPQAGMSVRCAKDESRLLPTPTVKNPKVITVASKITVETEKENALSIYPNPFKNEFFIKSQNASQFEMYDMSGKLVLKGKVEEGKVNSVNVKEGVYVVKVMMDNGSVLVKKLIKN